MRKGNIKNLFTKLHFYLLGFAVLNFLIKSITDIGLNYQLAYFITILIYISGLILFFWYLKPFKKFSVYFSFYFITPVIILLFWMFGGIFFGLLASFVMYPIQPHELKLTEKNIHLYEKYNGFLGACCPYEVTERQLVLLEKKLQEVNLHDEINQSNSSIITNNGQTELKVNFKEYEFYDFNSQVKDTIILIKEK